jgi:diadenylate cyclase
LDLLKYLNFYNFSPLDIVISVFDIIIVAFVLYRLIMLIKGTRAVQLLKGLVVLLVATAVSDWLGLDTVHWLLRQTMTALVVALPIVFQPELRRALEKIGGGRFLARPLTLMAEDDRTDVIDEVVRSVRELAQTRTGALIVLERNTGLEEYIDAGVQTDAVLSAELLINIFVIKTPLHDGAAIIRGDRLAAAACVLPLSSTSRLARNLGTRHRAAVGITEQSDALAVVVSEETGLVSLAVEGNLSRGLEEDQLRERLSTLLQPKTGHNFSSFIHRR